MHPLPLTTSVPAAITPHLATTPLVHAATGVVDFEVVFQSTEPTADETLMAEVSTGAEKDASPQEEAHDKAAQSEENLQEEQPRTAKVTKNIDDSIGTLQPSDGATKSAPDVTSGITKHPRETANISADARNTRALGLNPPLNGDQAAARSVSSPIPLASGSISHPDSEPKMRRHQAVQMPLPADIHNPRVTDTATKPRSAATPLPDQAVAVPSAAPAEQPTAPMQTALSKPMSAAKTRIEAPQGKVVRNALTRAEFTPSPQAQGVFVNRPAPAPQQQALFQASPTPLQGTAAPLTPAPQQLSNTTVASPMTVASELPQAPRNHLQTTKVIAHEATNRPASAPQLVIAAQTSEPRIPTSAVQILSGDQGEMTKKQRPEPTNAKWQASAVSSSDRYHLATAPTQNTAPPDAPAPERLTRRMQLAETQPVPQPAAPMQPAQQPMAAPLQWAAPLQKAFADIDGFERAATELTFTTSRTEAPHLQTQSTLPTTATLPAHVMRQLAEALAPMPNRPVEITLSPEELGRVRLTIKTTETGVVVALLAERPETLDLLRRNIDLLGQDFEALGYEDIAFSFSDSDRQADTDSDPQDNGEDRSVIVDTPTDITPTQVRSAASSGLDLRL